MKIKLKHKMRLKAFIEAYNKKGEWGLQPEMGRILSVSQHAAWYHIQVLRKMGFVYKSRNRPTKAAFDEMNN